MALQYAEGRRFWVVSPNVNDNNHTVGEWRAASVRIGAAFMGYNSDDHGHRAIGYNFAHTIMPGDVILIARRFGKEPQVVGFGVAHGKFLTKLPGFTPPGSLGSLRKLSPFVPLSRAPKSPQIAHVLRHTMALRELHPSRDPTDRSICNWMLKKIAAAADKPEKPTYTPRYSKTRAKKLTHQNELEYEVRTRGSVLKAQRLEAELVNAYKGWVERQDRSLEALTVNGQRFDAYERSRHNLIEAKCHSGQQYIRMAVGQLLEYASLLAATDRRLKLAILLPQRPEMDRLSWLGKHKISVVWKEKTVFLDNANGQFT